MKKRVKDDYCDWCERARDPWIYSCIFEDDGEYCFELCYGDNLAPAISHELSGSFVTCESVNKDDKQFFTVFDEDMDEYPVSSHLKVFKTVQEMNRHFKIRAGELLCNCYIWVDGRAYHYPSYINNGSSIEGLIEEKYIR